MMRSTSHILLFAALALGLAVSASAQPISNQVAVYSGLDKITARITTIEAPIGSTTRFGALSITPRACYTRPPTEPPQTTSFVEIDEQQINGGVRRIFTGWMFASSPGLHGVEHPVYDVWLKTCKSSSGGKSDGILKNSP